MSPETYTYHDAPPNVLSGGNQWDTAAFLRACADHVRGNRIAPMRDALDEAGIHDDEHRAHAKALALAVLRRSGYGAEIATRFGPPAEHYEGAAEWLDAQMSNEAAR